MKAWTDWCVILCESRRYYVTHFTMNSFRGCRKNKQEYHLTTAASQIYYNVFFKEVLIILR